MIWAAVSDGMAARINQPVIADIQLNTGTRNQPMFGAQHG